MISLSYPVLLEQVWVICDQLFYIFIQSDSDFLINLYVQLDTNGLCWGDNLHFRLTRTQNQKTDNAGP